MAIKVLTDTRREILENIRDGKDPYDGFEGSQLGGAIRSVQMMIGILKLVAVDDGEAPNNNGTRLVLTDAGRNALKRGWYRR